MKRFKARFTGPSLTAHNAAAQGLEVLRRVVSIDIGITNYAVCRLAYVRDTGTDKCRYVVERAAVLDLSDGQGMHCSADVYGKNLWDTLNGSDMEWMWKPESAVCIERQVDQIQALGYNNNNKEDDSGSDEKKPKYKPPFMHVLYGMTMMIVLAHAAPTAVLDDDAWQALDAANIDPTGAVLVRSKIKWVPRSGSQKSELKGFHGDERKKQTLIKAPELAERNKDDKYVDYMMLLAKPKPREDACDSYLQAHHYLNEQELEEQKAQRKVERETNKKRKAEAIAEKRQAKKARPSKD